MTNAGADAQTFLGSTPLLTDNPTTEDGGNYELVSPRSVEMDVATITLTPTVRWTAIDTPTANQTVTWKMDYTYAMPTLVPNGAADAVSKFGDVRTLTTGVTTLSGAEYRQHMVSTFQSFSFPARNFAPSCCVIGNVRISSVSTAANSLIGMLGVGCSYLEVGRADRVRLFRSLTPPRAAGSSAARTTGSHAISCTTWGAQRIRELLTHSELDPVFTFGNGEVCLLSIETPPPLVGRQVRHLTIAGEMFVLAITRQGQAFIPLTGTEMQVDDIIHLVILASSMDRFKDLIGYS